MSTETSIRSRVAISFGLGLTVPVLAFLSMSAMALGGYDEDIAPLLLDKCNSCHATQAPTLTTYDQVKSSIASIVTTISVDPTGPEKDKLMPKNGPKMDQA